MSKFRKFLMFTVAIFAIVMVFNLSSCQHKKTTKEIISSTILDRNASKAQFLTDSVYYTISNNCLAVIIDTLVKSKVPITKQFIVANYKTHYKFYKRVDYDAKLNKYIDSILSIRKNNSY